MQAKMQTQLDAMNAKLDKFIQEHAAPAAPAAKGNSMSPKEVIHSTLWDKSYVPQSGHGAIRAMKDKGVGAYLGKVKRAFTALDEKELRKTLTTYLATLRAYWRLIKRAFPATYKEYWGRTSSKMKAKALEKLSAGPPQQDEDDVEGDGVDEDEKRAEGDESQESEPQPPQGDSRKRKAGPAALEESDGKKPKSKAPTQAQLAKADAAKLRQQQQAAAAGGGASRPARKSRVPPKNFQA